MSHLHLAAPSLPFFNDFENYWVGKTGIFLQIGYWTFVCTNIQKIKERIIFQKFPRRKKILYKKFVHYITPSRAKNLQLFCQQRKIKIIYNFFLLFYIIVMYYLGFIYLITFLWNLKFLYCTTENFFTNHYINEKFYNFNRIKQDYQDIII